MQRLNAPKTSYGSIDWHNHCLATDQTLHIQPTMFMDSATAQKCAETPSDNAKQRHIDLRAHALREAVQRGGFSITHVGGKENPADQPTKLLGDMEFCKHRKFHRMLPRPSSDS